MARAGRYLVSEEDRIINGSSAAVHGPEDPSGEPVD